MERFEIDRGRFEVGGRKREVRDGRRVACGVWRVAGIGRADVGLDWGSGVARWQGGVAPFGSHPSPPVSRTEPSWENRNE